MLFRLLYNKIFLLPKDDWLIYREDLKDNINITRKKKSTFYWMKECKQTNLGRWQDVKIIGLKIYIIGKSFKEDFYCGIAIFFFNTR